MRNPLKFILKAVIRIYAYAISPLIGAKCRFYPTCSAYAAQAIDRHGVIKGVMMAVQRLLKCHPWYRGKMIDPVPASIAWGHIIGYKRDHCGTHADCGCINEKEKE